MSASSSNEGRPSLDDDGSSYLSAAERAAAWQREFAQTGGAFSSAFQHAAIGMAIVDLDGRFLKLNRSFCRIAGYEEAELLATDFQAITHPDDLDIDVALARQLREAEIDHYHLDKRYLRRDGSEIWVQLSVSMVRDEQGQSCYFISQIQDITARKRAEHDAARRLRHLQRLTQTMSLLLKDLDAAPDDDQYERWLRILMKAFGSPLGIFLCANRDDVLVGPRVAPALVSRVRYRPAHRLEVWEKAIRTQAVIAENRARRMEDGSVAARALVGPIVFEGALVGIIHLCDAGADYDADDCDLLERVICMIAPVVAARLKRESLTPRELEVMEMLVAGQSQKEIAQALDISVQTAAKHRARLLDKLHLKNDVELVHLSMRMRRPLVANVD